MARDLRQKFTWVDAAAGTPHEGEANGDSFPMVTGRLQNLGVQLGGTFTATVTVKAKLHTDFDYETIATATGKGIIPITVYPERVKLVISGYSSGTVFAVLTGFNVQPG